MGVPGKDLCLFLVRLSQSTLTPLSVSAVPLPALSARPSPLRSPVPTPRPTPPPQDVFGLPRRQIAQQILHLVRKIVFPGIFADGHRVNDGNLKYHLGVQGVGPGDGVSAGSQPMGLHTAC